MKNTYSTIWALCVPILTVIMCSSGEAEVISSLNHTALGRSLAKSSKMVDEELCVGASNIGICLPNAECASKGGVTDGTCWNSDTCCKIIARCPSTSPCSIRQSGTRITNEHTSNYRRTYRFVKGENICQLRLDFDEFEIEQPSSNGECTRDLIQILSVRTPLGICGKNTGQHVYVDFDYRSYIDVTARIANIASKYNIRATFIECNSEKLAPRNCLQYYSDYEGSVESFNFGHQQLNNQQYSVSIEALDGFGQIQWRPCAGVQDPFFISGSGVGVQPSTVCDKDYIQIYGATRYCGKGFAPLTSNAKPFLLRVNFDEAEGISIQLPTDPSECPFRATDPYTGLTFECTDIDNSGSCVCSPVQPFPPAFPVLDAENTGFCLKYSQLY